MKGVEESEPAGTSLENSALNLSGKRVTVVGLGRSGVGAANLLSRLGARVTVTDKKSPGELADEAGMLSPGIRTALGSHPLELFENADLIVVSPGVPSDATPLKVAVDAGVRVIGELELAYHSVRGQGVGTAFLAVTGTNGKSTTTSLLYEVVRASGFSTFVGGNIGNPLTGELIATVPGEEIDYIVTEVSSFQLELIDAFRPKGAALLNITPDHLDRYASLDEYAEAKCRIFLNQTDGDYLVLNGDDPYLGESVGRRLAGRPGGPDLFFFSRLREVEGAYYRNGVISFRISPERMRRINPGGSIADLDVPVSSLRIKGVHNIENAMAAGLVALLAGCSRESVMDTFRTFPGLEHRLEFVREMGGVTFVNDSKGTNVGAVIKSLESFNEPVVLIAGGRDKHGDFSVLAPLVKQRVKAAVLIGEAKETIARALGSSTRCFMEDDLASAVRRSRDVASPGDVVLLSPACASFDMFRDFEDRGRQFKKIVGDL